ncbi:hypothetical protein [Rhizobium leguminosarum]|uniref:hypothetical protein n=1 Tax=Rhizobium leguminosarum TaxID=384 RepID=UPI0013EF2E52|nr:hypothetical protein [Rhizobium leguminosarum]
MFVISIFGVRVDDDVERAYHFGSDEESGRQIWRPKPLLRLRSSGPKPEQLVTLG